MPDERQDSIRQGINTPAESPEGTAAAEERRRRAAESPPIGGAMGGTSDTDRPGDEAQANAARRAGETGETLDAADAGGRTEGGGGLEERARVIRETREAGQRAQGGGYSEESDIDRAADE